MTEAVADRLEVIQVDEQQGAQGVFALLTVHRMLQAVEQQTPIGQTGEFIAERQSLNFTLITLTFGNIGDAAANQHRLTGHAYQTYLARNLSPFAVAVQPVKYWRLTVHCPLQVNLTQLSRKLAIGLFVRAQIKYALAGDFLAAITQQTQGIVVALDQRSVEIEQQDRLRRILDDGAVARLGLQALADVFDKQQKHAHPTGAVAHRTQADTGVHQAAVGPTGAR